MNTLFSTLAAAVTASLMLGCSGPGNNAKDAHGNNMSMMGNQNMSGMANHDMSKMSNHDMADIGEMRSAPDANKEPYDLQFIDTMIFHHQGALKMAEMVLGKTQRTELKTFAQKIIADQTREIDLLKKWRDGWYGGNPSALNMDMPGMMNEGMKVMNSEHIKSMDEMEPAHFDGHFLNMMVPHHRGAIEMANEALKRATHQEIKDLAENIISTQSAEIKQMEKWKASWDKH